MTVTEEQRKQLLESSKPLMEFLANNFHPHVTANVTLTSVELVEGLTNVTTDQFILDLN
jgi:hypothetical protein